MLGLCWVEREGEGEEAREGDGSSHAFNESREGRKKSEEELEGIGQVVLDSVGEKSKAEDEGPDLSEKPSLSGGRRAVAVCENEREEIGEPLAIERLFGSRWLSVDDLVMLVSGFGLDFERLNVLPPYTVTAARLAS